MLLLFNLFVLKIIEIKAKPDLCGNNGIDLSILNDGTIWNLTHIQNDRIIHLMLSLCKPFDKFDANSKYKECDNKSICLSYRDSPQVISLLSIRSIIIFINVLFIKIVLLLNNLIETKFIGNLRSKHRISVIFAINLNLNQFIKALFLINV
jgi:hypothetical protein